MNSGDGMFWRKYSDPFLAGTLLKFIPRNITPNQVSWLRVLSWPVVFYFLYVESFGWGLVVFFLSALTDAIDGAMARTRDRVTDFGKILDPVADKGLIGVVVLTVIPKLFGWFLIFYIIALEIFHAIMAYYAIKKLRHNPGSNWAGSIKTFIQFTAFIILFIGLLFSFPEWINFSEIMLYISLLFTFLAAFLYK